MKLKIAVVGVGYIGLSHLGGIEHCDNVELVALVTRSEKVRAEQGEKYHVPCFATITEMCAQIDVDIIDICVPTFLHEEYVIEAAKCKKHILCEKPIALTMESYHRMLDAVNEAGVHFMVAQVLRFWPEYMRIRALYDAGKFGKINICHAKRICELPGWQTWFRDPAKSGGAIYDLMLHDLDYVQSMFGEMESVFATGGKNAQGAWNHVLANIKFKSGAGCMVEACEEAFGHFPFTMGLRIFGDDMICDFTLHAGHNIHEPATTEFYTYTREGDPVVENAEQSDPFGNEIAYFADCIMKDVPCARCTPESSEKTLALVLAIKQSLETGELVKL